ncbi:hypothetical protein [Flavihumibacter profundi]|uniref:hypothetical protein n=1 Tax=Flavihumibacter profundi TaxID=2716883 RepID=UPI001CC5C319|nr:hypothetical protein [Flavihumibacter profundi]MBZ5856170.1 hypothetical protein [Flavihumibacter profundi]
MQQYRLLRNNRETGPYTWQDLIDLGLKAYDLVWAEGKSSSWRYPSEFEELKAHAPQATEDFYVQFHTPALAKQVAQPTAVKSATVKKNNQRRYVSVILPQMTKKPEVATIVQPIVQPIIQPVVQPIVQSVPKLPEKTEISQREDRDISIHDALPNRSRNRFLIAGAFLVVLAGGIYFGTSQKSWIKPKVIKPDQQAESPEKLINPSAGVTDEIKNDDIVRLQPNAVLNFAAYKRYVEVIPGNFKVGFFGGVYNLQLIVKNTSNNPLKNIVIAIDYLNKNKTISHTENIRINTIEANQSLTVLVPDSRDGIAFQTRVIRVNNLSAP